MTPEQMRDEYLRAVVARIDYWLAEDRAVTPQEKLDGLAFTLLSLLDGSGLDVPGCQVVPRCDEEGWSRRDIGGSLHEHFHRVLREVRGKAATRAKGLGDSASAARDLLNAMTDEQRREVFAGYCGTAARLTCRAAACATSRGEFRTWTREGYPWSPRTCPRYAARAASRVRACR